MEQVPRDTVECLGMWTDEWTDRWMDGSHGGGLSLLGAMAVPGHITSPSPHFQGSWKATSFSIPVSEGTYSLPNSTPVAEKEPEVRELWR